VIREAKDVIMELDGETGHEHWKSGNDLGIASFTKSSEEALNIMLNFSLEKILAGRCEC